MLDLKKLDSSESDASLWAKSLITGATLAVVSVFLLGVLMLWPMQNERLAQGLPISVRRAFFFRMPFFDEIYSLK